MNLQRMAVLLSAGLVFAAGAQASSVVKRPSDYGGITQFSSVGAISGTTIEEQTLVCDPTATENVSGGSDICPALFPTPSQTLYVYLYQIESTSTKAFTLSGVSGVEDFGVFGCSPAVSGQDPYLCTNLDASVTSISDITGTQIGSKIGFDVPDGTCAPSATPVSPPACFTFFVDETGSTAPTITLGPLSQTPEPSSLLLLGSGVGLLGAVRRRSRYWPGQV
jgi:hypothetical protein